ncbi:hypothetical protein UPYG_G00294270 [Umbra pygmaea]|uniref:Caspase-8 n=1 Tax=Umbra pygmaea TaxID=75934 RepID=A0ABD0W682_UMBPY
MDVVTLSKIDEDLDSSEVAALCFLCRDVLNRKELEKVKDGLDLFMRLQGKGLLDDPHFLSQLLDVIGRRDLLHFLERNSRQLEGNTQTDACPILSQYRKTLYKVSENITQENHNKMKFLLIEKLPRGRLEPCTTALEVLCEMERQELLTEDNLDELLSLLKECDTQLVQILQQYTDARGSRSVQESSAQPIRNQEHQHSSSPHFSLDQNINHPPSLESLSISVTQPLRERGQSMSVSSDAVTETLPASGPDQMERYHMTRDPRGTCFIVNNHYFDQASSLSDRQGTEKDEDALRSVFTRLGFKVEVGKDMDKTTMLRAVQELAGQSHLQADALVVCVLSHGEKGCVFGTDGGEVPIRSLTLPFTSARCPSLTGKPKLFFIQACQGKGYQKPVLLPASIGHVETPGDLEADAGAIESVPSDADFLIGMATVEDYKSFRNTAEGSIYIQELCKQLEWGASCREDILSVLTRVNLEVSRRNLNQWKQMPEPKYTLTKKLYLPYL